MTVAGSFVKIGLVSLLVFNMFFYAVLPSTVFGDAPSSEREDNLNRINSGPSLMELEEEPGWSYNSDYLFALTRAVRDAGLHDAAKVPLFIPSIIFDAGLLPFALLAGLFG